MFRLRGLIALLFVLCAPALCAAASPGDAAFVNGKIRIADLNGDGGYRLTKNAVYAAIRQKMMKRQALEELVKFLSPVRLPKTLWVYVDECQGGAGASPYYTSANRSLVMCYQFMKIIEDRAAYVTSTETKNPNAFPMRVSHDEFVAGVFAGVILHEAGHALFDILEVPIFGREEDAADEIAIFVALQFKKQLADVVVGAFADIDETFSNPPTTAPDTNAADYPKDKTAQCFVDPFCAFADVHGTWGQRFYNSLCLTYGSDPQHYAFLQTGGWLPQGRDCVGEYQQIYHAFATTIYPFIDQDLRAKVQARPWFLANEMK
jgi:Putative metallopeptidase